MISNSLGCSPNRVQEFNGVLCFKILCTLNCQGKGSGVHVFIELQDNLGGAAADQMFEGTFDV